MRKYQKAAVVVAMLGSVSFLGAGVGHAGDDPSFKLNNKQAQNCVQNDSVKGLINVDDVNVSAGALLGWSAQDASESEALSCVQGFKLGK
ncbi:hypothetical protein HCJ93_25630 [Streptomyces sp. SBST2-5]|uniref:Secreted protein n=1 Tax=Streptomyces composti TaxID=2720025 RepID=A0ABX1AHS7_9ACTN|nr:hypothetical protein [Streptomyces composti]NJP53353.1 hypothetical protein [Streptomyces composti]